MRCQDAVARMSGAICGDDAHRLDPPDFASLIRATGLLQKDGERWSSTLQLALELIEETPVRAVRDDLCRSGFDHAGFAQPQGIEADRVLGIVLAPLVVP